MHHISSKNNSTQQSPKKYFGSFATKAFVATATGPKSSAAYYFAAVLLFISAAVVNGGGADGKHQYNFEIKIDDKYGIKYIGFDSYPGLELDDGTGVATKEVKAESVEIVSKALDAAGLDENGIKKGITGIAGGEDNTLHPKHAHRVGLGTCPLYGCPFLPLDVHYDDDVRAQLDVMRGGDTSSKDEGTETSPVIKEGTEYMLNSSGSEKAATLTLIGYKGGELENQINQDRTLALAPYLYWNIYSNFISDDNGDSFAARPVSRLIGAFDGHAKHGEKVSEYVAKTLPALLGSKLINYTNSKAKDEDADKHQTDEEIGKILRDTFLELDATSPADPSGGCTASTVLQIGTKIYIANAGDSRSFIAVRIASPAGDTGEDEVAIVYGTREDKAHLPTERERVEHMGGTVYLPEGFLSTGQGTTRVLYIDPTTGGRSGLAMSRSIGDWEAGEVGVIPDPLIDILDMIDIKQKVLEKMNKNCDGNTGEATIDPASGEPTMTADCVKYTEKDVQVFAISATDGLLDYLPEQAIATHVAKGLYSNSLVHDGEGRTPLNPLIVCEDLIYAAAQGWQEGNGGRYRDDIAISIADLELE